MFCLKCDDDHPMQFIITESNKEREIWRCRRCGYQEEYRLSKDDNPKKRKKGD